MAKATATMRRAGTSPAKCPICSGWVTAVRNWKGRKLSYTLGVLDVASLFYLLDYLGMGQYANVRSLVELARSWFVG